MRPGGVRRIAAAGCAVLTLLGGAAYLAWYGPGAECFDAQGRCFDPDTGVVHHAQAGIAWLLLTGLAGAATLWLLWRR